jgi:4-hydroxyphenylacetate 3-monooxygenase
MFEHESGQWAHLAYKVPESVADLQLRRAAIEQFSRLSYGFFNRGPEYKSGFVIGMMSNLPFFGEYADNVGAFYRRVCKNNLYLNHIFVTPQVDRDKPPSEQPESHLYVGVVRESDKGIVIRGAKMVGTAAALNHEIVVGHYGGLQALSEADKNHAIMFAVPVNAPGVRLISRSSFRKPVRSPLDAPLSHYLEENDLTVIFDDVLIPWENVFVYRDIERSNTWMVDTPSLLHLINNNAIRFRQKLEFLTGLALRIAESSNVQSFRGVQATLGELAVYTGMLKGLIVGAEAAAITLPSGKVVPDPEIILSYRALGPMIYPKVVELIEGLAGGSMIQLPDSVLDMMPGAPLADESRYYRGASIDGVDKICLMKLSWDVLRSDFGGRHVLFERFHAGNPEDTFIQYFQGTNASRFGEQVDELIGRARKDDFLQTTRAKSILQTEYYH